MATATDPVRVLHVTDPHLFAQADAKLRGRDTRLTLQQVLEHVRLAGWPADLVVMTGDVVQDDSREAYERFRRMLEPLGLPVYCLPGNHDVRPLMSEILGREPFHYCEAVEVRNWLIVGIDSCLEDSAGGHVAETELDRLEKLIAGTRAEHALVCLHHPPLPVGSKWLDELRVQNGEELLQRLQASGKARMTLFGHVHQAFEGQYASIRVVGTPSTCRQFKAGSDTFAVVDEPPAYRRVTLHPDGSTVTELVQVAVPDDEAT